MNKTDNASSTKPETIQILTESKAEMLGLIKPTPFSRREMWADTILAGKKEQN